MTDFFKILKQAQEMQERLKSVQDQLEQLSVTGTAGAGLVTVVADGRGHIRSVKIDPSVVRADDVEMLEDLVAAAVSDAQKKAAEAAQEGMDKLTGSLDLPFKLPL
jgi:DNA-binding YbaB/EbfC family protein